MTNIRYLPSSAGIFKWVHDWYDKKGGVDFVWWTKKSLVYYPYIMLSYGSFMDERSRDYWDINLNVGEDVYVMADSGGYQKASKDLGVTPKEVLAWQEGRARGHRVDAGIILDHPPRLALESVSRKHFVSCAENTKNNIEDIEGKLETTPIEIYGVLQGINREELELWWDIALEPFSFGNISVTARDQNPVFLAMALAFLKDKNIKNAHFLGISSAKTIAFLHYCKSLDFDNIFYDSSSFAKISGFGKAYSPYLTQIPCGFKAEKTGMNMDKFSRVCDCPICRYNVKYGKNYAKMDRQGYIRLAVHNLYQLIKFQEFCNWLSEGKDAFQKFCKDCKWNNVIQGMKFIDKYLDEGFEAAYGEIVEGREKGQKKLREW